VDSKFDEKLSHVLFLLYLPRYVPMFGHSEYDPSNAYSSVPIEEQLKAVDRAVAAGKVLHFGLSNETPWGLMRFRTTAEYLENQHSLPHSDCTVVGRDTPQRAHQRHACATPVSLQNAYSLTCRTFDSGGLAECCHQEGIGLLAYSPLAMGLLTGKYLRADGGPSEARLNKYRGRYAEAESRYGPKSNVREAVQAYIELATRWGMAPVELAIRFVLSHPLVTAAVTGATSKEQLKELIAAAGRPPLQAEIRAEIDAIHRRYPNPTP
jgi:aryl-alcohol dehydrogenase-like predicted oxidoreductase